MEHARIAGELARAWGNERFASHSLLFGIDHHDHGWGLWDDAPLFDVAIVRKHLNLHLNPAAGISHLNPATGIPRSFMEMRMHDSTAIWTKSVDLCGVEPLAGIGVSRHFCHLAKQAKTRLPDAEDCEAIEKFLDEQALREADLAERVRLQFGGVKTAADLERTFDFAFQSIRFFDRVSLWLCCAEQTRPETIAAPTGETATLIPKGPLEVAIDPYPLTVDALRLEAPARRIAARTYTDGADYRTAFNAAPIELLTWSIQRG
jgi:Protein of unknown function (DUF3891)